MSAGIVIWWKSEKKLDENAKPGDVRGPYNPRVGGPPLGKMFTFNLDICSKMSKNA